MSAPLVDVGHLLLAGDYRALWVALIRTLPECSECSAPSAHVLQLYPQDVPSYLCSRNRCHEIMRRDNAHAPEVIDGWRPAPWIDHVIAAEMANALRKDGGR